MKLGKIDYERRNKFLISLLQWVSGNQIKHPVTHLARELKVSKSTVSLWFKPFEDDKVNISMLNIYRIEKLTGLKYEPFSEYEKNEYRKVGEEYGSN